ncbi:glycogen synthase isoform X1 [Olea europaea var. sylvestris]|uniref:glycogen synthase isoform X1 n=1 Tax=Olea europaea var. sylvestris TaxID=158386 RepID=UPI000C1D51BD|nr:glycogen synthase isoform X1 [Olea europaea var. sylvestris]
MEMLVIASIPKVLHLPQFISINQKHDRHRSFCCFGKNGESNDLSTGSFERDRDYMEVHQNQLQSINNKEEKQTDIWQLFREAQQNILYLNKQRLTAIEELDRVKNERQSLVNKIEQLEAKKQGNTRRDKLAISSELLLKIDSMVLTGIIGGREASDFRKLIMDSRGGVTDDLYDTIYKKDAELLAKLRHFSVKGKKKGFHIVHICTEMEPVVSVGILASYVTGISLALQRKGNLVEVILPKYAELNLDEVQGFREVEAQLYSYFNGQLHENKVWTGVVHGIGVTFIQPVYYSSFFSQERVYGYSNDFERFTYFSRASLDYIVKSGKQPDVLHIHNWQTSIIGPLFWDVFVNQGLEGTRILLTCQGFDSQCLEQPEKLALCGLDPSRLYRLDRLQDNKKAHLVNILKVGCIYSDISEFDLENLKMLVWMASKKGVQFIFMGFSQSAGISTALEFFKEEMKDGNVRFIDNYDDELSHLIFAGSDILLCPSFDNLQLQVPLKALKYGAAPIAVRPADSRFSPNRHFGDHDMEGTEFSLFINKTFAQLSLSQAVEEITKNPSEWNRRMTDAMMKDFSWDAECSDIHIRAYSSIKEL